MVRDEDEIRRSVVDCGAFGRNGINKRDAFEERTTPDITGLREIG